MSAFFMTILLTALNLTAVPAVFYVSPGGDDGGPGTLEAPFATIQRAQAATRARITDGDCGDVTVYIRGGVFYLDAPLVFTPADGGDETRAVTYKAYKGEMPVFSGGRPVTGWKRGEGDRWTAGLPEIAAGSRHFRQLFREETRLPRGRFPNGEDLLRVAAVDDTVTEITLKEPLPVLLTAGEQAELVVYQNWSITRMPVMAAEGANLRVSHPAGWIGHGDATTTSPDKPCFVENAPAFVDVPGEWYLDRNVGTVLYQAAPGEDPNQALFIAPRLELLLSVEGDAGAPVLNLHFEGLSFAHAEWPLPEFGYVGIQAGHYGTSMAARTYVLPGAVKFSRAENCGMTRCCIAHTGASGIVLGAACRDITILQCDLEDIGGTGIMVGWRGDALDQNGQLYGEGSLSADWLAPDLVPTNNMVAECALRRCGAVNYGCVGVFDAFCDGTRIRHNDISDMPYTGISVGFRWDSSETTQRNSVVEFNHVHNVMKMLADGGAIYTLGYQPGTVLRGNLLHDVHRSAFAHGGAPNNGIFFDQGSKGFLVEDNIIYNTSGEPIRFNQTSQENLTFNNNSFGTSPDDPAFPKDAAVRAGRTNK